MARKVNRISQALAASSVLAAGATAQSIESGYNIVSADFEIDTSSNHALIKNGDSLIAIENAHYFVVGDTLYVSTQASEVLTLQGVTTNPAQDAWAYLDEIATAVIGGGGASYIAAKGMGFGPFQSAPTISSAQSFSVSEGTSGAVGNVLASSTANTSLSYSLRGEDAGLFKIDNDGVIAVKDSSQLDYESGRTSFDLDVVVTDGNGNQSVGNVSISVLDVDEAPEFGAETAALSHAENTQEVHGYQASDQDTESADLKYEIIGGADASLFEIDKASGALLFAQAPDFEAASDQGTDNTYEVEIQVTDTSGNSDSIALNIQVENVNEAPDGIDGTIQATEDTPYAFSLEAFGFSDPDGDGLVNIEISALPTQGELLLSGQVVEAGQSIDVSQINQLTYQANEHANGNALDQFEFKVSDGELLSVEPAIVTIDVEAIDDPMAFITNTDASVQVSVYENDDVTALYYNVAADPDGEVTYALEGADASLFDVDQEQGAINFIDGFSWSGQEVFNLTLTALSSDDATEGVSQDIQLFWNMDVVA